MKRLQIKIEPRSAAELQLLRQAAKRVGLELSPWARLVLLSEARRMVATTPSRTPAPAGVGQ